MVCGKTIMFKKYVLLLELLLINAKFCITHRFVANTSIHVSKAKQVAP